MSSSNCCFLTCVQISQEAGQVGFTLCIIPCPWNSPSKDTGVGSHFILQGIFWTPVSNLGILHCRQIVYNLGPQGSPFTSQNGTYWG